MSHPTVTHTADARRYHWTMLALFAAISVAGNAWHALIVGRDGALGGPGAAVIAIVAPLALLASTHGLVVHLWTGKPTTGARTHRFTQAVAALLSLVVAAAAFALSFHALSDLARLSGVITPQLAPLFPIAIDLFMIQATVCLVAVARSAATGASPIVHAVRTEPDDGSGAQDTYRDPRAHSHPTATTTGAHSTDPTQPLHPQPHHNRTAAVVEDRISELARRINAGGRRDTTPESIARALRHVESGATHQEAADLVGVNRSTVTRWARQASQLDSLTATDRRAEEEQLSELSEPTGLLL